MSLDEHWLLSRNWMAATGSMQVYWTIYFAVFRVCVSLLEVCKILDDFAMIPSYYCVTNVV